jgi:hypothetical protein
MKKCFLAERKKTIAFVLLAALLVPLWAQEEADFIFEAATGTITLYKGFETDVTIPAAIGGKPVLVIGEDAFRKADLTSVIIPNSVAVIERGAFQNNKLTEIIIPGSVSTIGDWAFRDNQLTAVIIPEGVTSIGSIVFFNNELNSISFPSTLISSGDYGEHRNAPETVILASNIGITNGEEAFGNAAYYNYVANDRKAGSYTQNMQAVSKKEGDFEYYDTQYGAVLFQYNGNATRVRIPAELGGKPVKAIVFDFYQGVFENNKLVAVQLPGTLTYIDKRSFDGNQLTSVTLPPGLTYIGDDAFVENALTSITLPAGLTYIGQSAFSYNKIASLTIPNTVTYIGDSAFSDNEITAVSIPASVKIIREYTFPEALTTLTIAQGITRIEDRAFVQCRLTAVTIPPSVTHIGENAFRGGEGFTLTIPATVTSLGGAPVAEGSGSFILQKDYPVNFGYYGSEIPAKAGRYTWNGFSWQHNAR